MIGRRVKKRVWLLALAMPVLAALGVLLLTDCAPTAPATSPPTYTPHPTYTPYPTDTPLPTPTLVPAPTETSQPTPTPQPTKAPTSEAPQDPNIGANYLGIQQQGGLEIEIIRVVFVDKAHLESLGREFSEPAFDQVDTVGEIVLRVTNQSEEMLSIYPDQGIVIIGDEQISPIDYSTTIKNKEDTSGDIYPGVTRIGGFWFGVRRSSWDQIESMIYIIDSPSGEDYLPRGEKFRFEIDTTGWGFEPWPEEVK